MIDRRERALEELAAQRWGVAIRLSAAMLIVFGVYELLTAFSRDRCCRRRSSPDSA
jgi:uncharacterized membrane protein (DUF485 family)